jgi:outer membrane protein TolC
MALQHNFDVRIERYNPQIARSNLRMQYGAYDPSLYSSFSHSYSLSPGGVDSQNRTYSGSESEMDSISSGLRGLLPWGLNYALGVGLNDQYGTRPGYALDMSSPRVEYITLTNLLNPTEVFQYTVTNYATIPARDPFENTSGQMGFLQLRQPLLRNFWIDSTRLAIATRKKDLKITELALRNQVIQVVTMVQQAYYDLIYAYENVKVQQKALELAQRLLAENKKRVEVGAMAPLDEKSAESQAAVSRAALLAAQQGLAAQQNTLKNLMIDDYAAWHDVQIEPVEKLLPQPAVFDLQASWERGLTHRPDLLESRLSVERQNIVLRYSRNQLFPTLDLTGTYGYTGSGKEFSGALGQIGDGDNNFYSVGVELSIPLSNRQARESHKLNRAQKEQLLLQLKKLEQNIMVQIDNAVKAAQTSYEQLEATRQAREFAQAALEAEQKKLENGKSTSYQVLLLQRDLTQRSSDEIQALAQYNKALAALAQAEGTTLEKNNLTLEVRE